MKYLHLRLIVLTSMLCVYADDQNLSYFHAIYPLTSFKKVVDTCMRTYTDVLILHDQIAQREKSDEQLDLLVGRLMRLKSYIEQVIDGYRVEATISIDEITYLLQMIEYLELTIDENDYRSLADGLNALIHRLKTELKQALTISVWYVPTKVQRHPYWFPRVTDHSLQFA